MLALLTLVKPPASSSEQRSGSRHWSSVQQEELQLQALATLATIAPLMLDGYMSCQGNTCLLLLLDWCVRQGEDAAKPGERQTRPKTSRQSALEQNTESRFTLKCYESNKRKSCKIIKINYLKNNLIITFLQPFCILLLLFTGQLTIHLFNYNYFQCLQIDNSTTYRT